MINNKKKKLLCSNIMGFSIIKFPGNISTRYSLQKMLECDAISYIQNSGKELYLLLSSNFRNNERIDQILSDIFSDDMKYVKILSYLFKKSQFSHYSSMRDFIGFSFKRKLKNQIFNDYRKKEKAIYLIVCLGTNNSQLSFKDFFFKFTIKHYAFLVEQNILNIIPPGEEEKHNMLTNIVKEIFCSNEYKEFLLKQHSGEEMLHILRKLFVCSTKPRKIIEDIFMMEKYNLLKSDILFFIVKHGNKEYWKNKKKEDLFLC